MFVFWYELTRIYPPSLAVCGDCLWVDEGIILRFGGDIFFSASWRTSGVIDGLPVHNEFHRRGIFFEGIVFMSCATYFLIPAEDAGLRQIVNVDDDKAAGNE